MMERKDFLKGLLLTPVVTASFASDQSPLKDSSPSIFDFGAKGDGNHDDSQAFNQYLSKYDELYLPGGKTFKIGSIILRGKTIRGPGKIQIRVGAPGTFILEGNNNHIENVNFVSSGKGTRPESEIMLGKSFEYATVTRCSFSGNLFNAIGSDLNDLTDAVYEKLEWRNSLIINNCHFSGSYSHHLYLHRLDNLLVNSNFLETSGLDSIRLRQWVKNVNITNNIFKNIGISKSTDSKDAIDCYWSGLQLNIQGNQFQDIATHALDVKGHSPDRDYGTSKVLITGNQIRNAGFSGILISSGSKTSKGWKPIKNVTISNNLIEGCGASTTNPNDAAIFMRHNQEMVIINGNQIFHNKNKGIMLGNFEPDASISKNILIQGNLVSDNSSLGIHVSGGENVVVSDNILNSNEKGLVSGPYKNFKLTNFISSNNLVV